MVAGGSRGTHPLTHGNYAMGKDLNDYECGTRTKYFYGCRCDLCRAANAAGQRKWAQQGVESEFVSVHTEWQRATDLRWTIDAACYGKPLRWWFAGDGRNAQSKTTRRALEICECCTVQTECLDYALSFPYPWIGVFGGMTPQQRHKEATRRANENEPGDLT